MMRFARGGLAALIISPSDGHPLDDVSLMACHLLSVDRSSQRPTKGGEQFAKIAIQSNDPRGQPVVLFEFFFG
jgi:hypothetical protein